MFQLQPRTFLTGVNGPVLRELAGGQIFIILPFSQRRGVRKRAALVGVAIRIGKILAMGLVQIIDVDVRTVVGFPVGAVAPADVSFGLGVGGVAAEKVAPAGAGFLHWFLS